MSPRPTMTAIVRALLEQGITDPWILEGAVRRHYPERSPITHVYGIRKAWQREQDKDKERVRPAGR